MTAAAQATFMVEYPCDRFCRIEVDLRREHSQLTLQQMWQQADVAHERAHEPAPEESDPPVGPEPAGRPAATVFLAAPGRGGNRRR